MSFTAKLLGADKRDSYWELLVEFVDGDIIKQKSIHHSGTVKEFVSLLRSKVAKRETVKEADFIPFIGKIIDLTPDPITPTPDTTPEEIAKNTWFADYRTLNQMLEVSDTIPALATNQANTAIANLRASLEAGWLNSYLGDL